MNNSYTREEINEIVESFEKRGIAIKEAYAEGTALVIKWADAKQTGKEESIYYKMLGA